MLNDYILEDKDEDDDGLLQHGINKIKNRENPYYTDYKNKQIMAGKPVKTYKGWKKEEKSKKFLKRAAIVAGTVGTVAGGRYIYKMRNDPSFRQRQRGKKNINHVIDVKAAQDKKTLTRHVKNQARAEREPGIFSRVVNFVTNHFGKEKKKSKEEATTECVNFLLENFSTDEILSYCRSFNESDEQKEAYKKYVKRCKDNKVKHKSYKEWKKDKGKMKRRIALGVVTALGAGYGVGNHFVKKKTNKTIKQNLYHHNQMRKSSNNDARFNTAMDVLNNGHERMMKLKTNEELFNFGGYNLALYNETINNDDEFNRRSYNSYCVMMESRGLTPLDEGLFDAAKKQLSSYATAAINGIQVEQARRAAKKKEAEEEKEKKKQEEAAKEKEKLEKMSPEEKEEYLKKKRKEEKEKEEREKEKKETIRIGYKNLIKGASEEAGKRVAKLLTKPFGI